MIRHTKDVYLLGNDENGAEVLRMILSRANRASGLDSANMINTAATTEETKMNQSIRSGRHEVDDLSDDVFTEEDNDNFYSSSCRITSKDLSSKIMASSMDTSTDKLRSASHK